MKPLLAAIAFVGAAAIVSPASAHRVDAYISPSGLEFIEEQALRYLPEYLAPPPMERSFLCVDLVQRDTSVDFEFYDLSLDMPRDGVLRLELDFSLRAEGELFIDNLYSCFGEATCRNELALSNARVVVEFQLELHAGTPRLVVHDVQLLAEPEELEIALSDCAIDGVVNTVVGWAQSLSYEFVLGVLADMVILPLAPMFEGILAGFITFEGTFGPVAAQAELLDVHAGEDGLIMAAEVELQSQASRPADCLRADAPSPGRSPGFPPSLAGGVAAHAGVALSLGLLNDIIYNVWRAGFMCMTDEYFAALGIDLELDYHVGKLLPGFPAETTFSLEVRAMEPPRLEPSASEAGALTLVMHALEISLIGHHRAGTDSIDVVTDLEATARIVVDRDANALVLEPIGVSLGRLTIDDVVGGAPLGVDAARLADMLENFLVPKLVAELGAIPVSGSIAGFADHYLLLRHISTSESYVSAKVDLFRAPDDDTEPPTTAIEARPEGLVAVRDAVLRLTGSDPEIPTELLRYRVVVDGEERPLSFVREVQVGEVGRSGSYRVEVSAVDLVGNEDPDPIILEVEVDGVAPSVTIEGRPSRTTNGPTKILSWRQVDDLTPAEELIPRLSLYRVNDTANLYEDELLGEVELEPGATSFEVPLGPDGLYRVELRVRDAVGNEGIASTLIRRTSGSGGCTLGAAGGASVGWLPLAALAALLRVRRRGWSTFARRSECR